MNLPAVQYSGQTPAFLLLLDNTFSSLLQPVVSNILDLDPLYLLLPLQQSKPESIGATILQPEQNQDLLTLSRYPW